MKTLLFVYNWKPLHGMVRDILDLEGSYPTRMVESAGEAYPLLRDHPEPLIVIFGDNLFDANGLDILRAVAEGGPRLQRYAYIEYGNREALLFREPWLSEYRELLSRFAVSRLSIPFTVDQLLDGVKQAERQLAAAR